MEDSLFELNKSIKELNDKRNELLSSIKNGMIIDFPDWDLCNGVNITEELKRLPAGGNIPFKYHSPNKNGLVFVQELDNGMVCFLSSYEIPARIEGVQCSHLTREDAYLLINRNNGKVLCTGVRELLKHF